MRKRLGLNPDRLQLEEDIFQYDDISKNKYGAYKKYISCVENKSPYVMHKQYIKPLKSRRNYSNFSINNDNSFIEK